MKPSLPSSSSSSITQTKRRKRSYPTSSFLAVSAVALSFSAASSAFQSSLASNNLPNHDRMVSPTMLSVVTDPKQLLMMELTNEDGSHRQTLEDIYLIATTDSDGLLGEMVEGIPSQRRSPLKTSNKNSETDPFTDAEALPPVRVQFKGLSNTPNPRGKRKSSLSRTPPTPKTNEDGTPKVSKSSTMPGFSDRSSGRKNAYLDGIRMAEQRSGKKFVDTSEAKKTRKQINGEAMYKTSASVPDSLVQFVNEVHDVDRITPKEEIVLGEKTQEAIRLQSIYDGLVMNLDREPTDEEWCAASGKINMQALSEAIEEGLEAKNTLVTSNLRMVQGVVNVYIRNGLTGQYNAGDLMQEGIMALIRAAEKFDPTRGFRFSTYAMYWIRSAIKRDQIFQSRVITVPQRLYESQKRIIRVQQELSAALGRAPSKAEIGQTIGMSEVQIERCLSAMAQKTYSLDQQISNPLKPMSSSDAGDTMYEVLESKADDGDYNKQRHAFLREDLINTLKRNLSDEEVQLLLLRYGLLDSIPQNLKNGPLTIAEVSRMVGLKPDKVRRLINRSLKHMRAVIGDEWIEYERELQ